MKRIVIFDMDGTLINSALDITISINYVRAYCYDLSPLSEQYIIDSINAYERNLAHLFYGTTVYEERAKVLFEEHYCKQCTQNVYSYNEIHETLSHLNSSGCLMSVATNAPSMFAHLMLAHLGIAEYFSCILGADNVDHPKPHPEIIEKILEHHDYQNNDDIAWMVGDSSKDMEAAKSAGIGTIFAAWGFSDKGEGDFIAYSPRDIKSIILEE
jgi:phosphoglycolate phosphatase